jgi:hypothetical protein
MVSEIANPMRLYMYQAEQNVRTLTLLPLWGCDIDGPNEMLLSDIPYGELQPKKDRINDLVIERYFLPLLATVGPVLHPPFPFSSPFIPHAQAPQLVDGIACKTRPSSRELQRYTSMIVNLQSYFSRYGITFFAAEAFASCFYAIGSDYRLLIACPAQV